MTSPAAEAAEGFLELAQWWLHLVGEEALRTASKIDAGTFDRDAAASASVMALYLPFVGLLGLGNELFDAGAVGLAAQPPDDVRSRPLADDRTTERRTIAPQPLRNGWEDVLPAARLRAEPPGLEPGQSSFRLVGDRHGVRTGTYTGTVVVTGTSGERSLPVALVVP